MTKPEKEQLAIIDEALKDPNITAKERLALIKMRMNLLKRPRQAGKFGNKGGRPVKIPIPGRYAVDKDTILAKHPNPAPVAVQEPADWMKLLKPEARDEFK